MSGHITSSHTLILVGGVSLDIHCSPDIIIINLLSKIWTGISLKVMPQLAIFSYILLLL